MLIDWFTVAAQIFNFLLLVWLLKRFLYSRILGAIDARESRIAASLAEAGAKQKEAADQLSLYNAKVQEIEEQREALLSQARSEAQKQYTEMFDKAQAQIRQLETRWKEDLERERNAFVLELRRRAATEIVAVARRAIADLTCLDLQECAIRVFLEKLRTMDDDARRKMAQSQLLVRTGMDLSDESKAQIRQAVEAWLQMPADLQFDSTPSLGLGLELRGNGWRIGWNSQSYLDEFEKELGQALEDASEVNATAGVI
jgi:F-type H+-transporting ATPase subunit b